VKTKAATQLVGFLILGACGAASTGISTEIGNIPEAAIAMAGPGQDLSTARYQPENRCFWYEHSGPVENTLLPLRTAGGNPICVPEEAES
jgi:hypothetical protein